MRTYCIHCVFGVRRCHDPGNNSLDPGYLPVSGRAYLSFDLDLMAMVPSTIEEHIQIQIQIHAEVIETMVTQHIDKSIDISATSCTPPMRFSPASDARTSH